MFLVIGFYSMLSLYVVAITTLFIITCKQGPQDHYSPDITKMTHMQ